MGPKSKLLTLIAENRCLDFGGGDVVARRRKAPAGSVPTAAMGSLVVARRPPPHLHRAQNCALLAQYYS
jgi:hypothetical protein